MKKLSIIIVNYNVRFFLEQCLQSVSEAIRNIDTEVFVVDNNSSDSSVLMVQQKFPWVKLFVNSENVGFARANNQAIRMSEGEYVLLLNPDTVIQPDTLEKVITFMDEHPDAGALGVKMIDGKGKFLPESKRGLPTPWVAFYKIFGLSALFPKSKIFGKYHLSYLNADQNHQVEVLSGAFMLIRRKVLDIVGLLDETFFMYGEDIDLSYRILKAGYKNYYFAGTTIIHYKGESTKKGSLNYVRTFYKAMEIFARKHFSQSIARIFFFAIRLAIYFRALLDVIKKIGKSIALPFFDFAFILSGYLIIARYWESITLHPEGGSYPDVLLHVALLAYTAIWMLSLFFAGAYDKHMNVSKILKGIGFGTIVILIIYSLLDQSLRFSRALIFLGAIWSVFVCTFNRLVFRKMSLSLQFSFPRRFLIVGNSEDVQKVHTILRQSLPIEPEFVAYVSGSTDYNSKFIGSIEQLEDIVRIYKIEEIIFSSKSLTTSLIIQTMTKLQNLDVSIKIAPPDAKFIIGSNSVNEKGDIYLTEINAINLPENRRKKRVFDFLLALFFLFSFPAVIWFIEQKKGFFKNIFLVLFNKKTWVGLPETEEYSLIYHLPGVITPDQQFAHFTQINEDVKQEIAVLYARNYSIRKDLLIIVNAFSQLGN